jgi:hypothetical protein
LSNQYANWWFSWNVVIKHMFCYNFNRCTPCHNIDLQSEATTICPLEPFTIIKRTWQKSLPNTTMTPPRFYHHHINHITYNQLLLDNDNVADEFHPKWSKMFHTKDLHDLMSYLWHILNFRWFGLEVWK